MSCSRSILRAGRGGGRCRAFTLIEMLVVIGLIAVIAALAAPALKTKSIALDAAHRQLADDLNRARQLAISTRSTVYVVFMPMIDLTVTVTNLSNPQRELLAVRQARGYALFSRTSVGAQPGREELRYLSEWKELPDGVFISTNKFASTDDPRFSGMLPMDFLPDIPIPTVEGSTYKRLPYIAYDYTGALTLSENGDVRLNRDKDAWQKNVALRGIIPLVAGSVSTVRAYDSGIKDMASQWRPANILVKPPYEASGNFYSITNYIRRVVIDPLTGRARVEGGEI
jgi:prepilin-type N-terminal cleavage/methylation domain-containing protein